VTAGVETIPAPGADVATAYRCRCCGTELERIGSQYWHVTSRPRCPITTWPAGSVEPAAPTGGAALPLQAASLTDLTSTGVTMSKRGGNKAKRVAKPLMPNKGPKAK
jgi:hypothetical protein